MDQDQPDVAQTIELVYLGQSPSGAYRWRHGENELQYGKLKARVFGGVYTVEAVITDDDHISVYPGTLIYTGAKSIDAAAVQAQALRYERELKATRLARSTGRTEELDQALAPLLELTRGLKTYGDRAAIVEYVTAQLWRG